MASCDYCGTRILFGGVKDNGMRFCNEDCHTNGSLIAYSQQLPDDVVEPHVSAVHQGDCPKCGGPGPIDVHTSYIVWSIMILTSWKSRPEVCCRSCGNKAKLGGLCISAVAGWWGIPWGFIFTPVQIFRNISGIVFAPDLSFPSPELDRLVRIHLVSEIAAQNQAEAEA